MIKIKNWSTIYVSSVHEWHPGYLGYTIDHDYIFNLMEVLTENNTDNIIYHIISFPKKIKILKLEMYILIKEK